MKEEKQSNRFNPAPASQHHNDTKSDDLHTPLTTKPKADIGIPPHEWHQMLDLLQWPGPDTLIKDFLKSTTPSTTYFYIPGLRKSYLVGEELRVTVVARDFHKKPKPYGGDYFQAKLFSPKLKASVFGEVTDLENGTYSVRFLLPWPGEAWVAVRLIHSSEAVQVLKQVQKYQSDRIYFKGVFVGTNRNGAKLEEIMECNSKWDGAGLERLQKSNCCEYPDPRAGEVWMCQRPKYLPCDTLVYHVMGGYRVKLGTPQNKLLDMKYTNKWINGNGKITIHPSNTTVGATEGCRPGLQIPVPAGFYVRDVWTSLVCTTGLFDAPKITQCLKDREIFMMGDSTMRQWFHYLIISVHGMKYMNLHSAERAGPLLAVDVENNILLHFRAHAMRLRTITTAIADMHYISNEIDGVAGGPRKVIIFNMWAHFTTLPLEYYMRRVARIRRAVIALLKRAPDTIVVIKSANTTSVKDIYSNDWFSIQLDTILRMAFQGINVAFIDVWQMTSCHYSKDSIHPNPTVIGNEINLLLSFICPV